MALANDHTLHLRLPRALRASLDAAAQDDPRSMSTLARRALIIGLASIRQSPSDPRDPPPPSAPAARQPTQVAA